MLLLKNKQGSQKLEKEELKRQNNVNTLKNLIESFGQPLSDENLTFTPSTPYVHKFRTEMCKNFETYGKCKYGDKVSNILDSRYLNSNLYSIYSNILFYNSWSNLF